MMENDDTMIIEEEECGLVPVTLVKSVSFHLEEICSEIDYLLDEDGSDAVRKMCGEYYTLTVEATGELDLDGVVYDSDYKSLDRKVSEDSDWDRFKSDLKKVENGFSRSLIKDSVKDYLEQACTIGVSEVRNGEWKYIDD